MKFIAHLIYWPLRFLWLLFCALLLTIGIGMIAFIFWAASIWFWEHAGTNKVEVAAMAALFICGGIIVASYEWAKRQLKK